jgi:hypothetical protein
MAARRIDGDRQYDAPRICYCISRTPDMLCHARETPVAVKQPNEVFVCKDYILLCCY